MPDLATIGAALSSLKTASDIVQIIRNSDLNLEQAEFKLKLADLVGALADTRIELASVQEDMIEKDRIIAGLKEAFENKKQLIRHLDAYYELDENGKPFGVPYCLK